MATAPWPVVGHGSGTVLAGTSTDPGQHRASPDGAGAAALRRTPTNAPAATTRTAEHERDERHGGAGGAARWRDAARPGGGRDGPARTARRAAARATSPDRNGATMRGAGFSGVTAGSAHRALRASSARPGPWTLRSVRRRRPVPRGPSGGRPAAKPTRSLRCSMEVEPSCERTTRSRAWTSSSSSSSSMASDAARPVVDDASIPTIASACPPWAFQWPTISRTSSSETHGAWSRRGMFVEAVRSSMSPLPTSRSAPGWSRMTRLSASDDTEKAMRLGMFALITPVITSTDGRCVAITRWMPTARAICAMRTMESSTSRAATIMRSLSSSTTTRMKGSGSIGLLFGHGLVRVLDRRVVLAERPRRHVAHEASVRGRRLDAALRHQLVVARDVAHAVLGQQAVAALHLLDRPGERVGRLLGVDHHRVREGAAARRTGRAPPAWGRRGSA